MYIRIILFIYSATIGHHRGGNKYYSDSIEIWLFYRDNRLTESKFFNVIRNIRIEKKL